MSNKTSKLNSVGTDNGIKGIKENFDAEKNLPDSVDNATIKASRDPYEIMAMQEKKEKELFNKTVGCYKKTADLYNRLGDFIDSVESLPRDVLGYDLLDTDSRSVIEEAIKAVSPAKEIYRRLRRVFLHVKVYNIINDDGTYYLNGRPLSEFNLENGGVDVMTIYFDDYAEWEFATLSFDDDGKLIVHFDNREEVVGSSLVIGIRNAEDYIKVD